MTMEEVALPCRFSAVVSHRGDVASFAVGQSISISSGASSGMVAVGIPLKNESGPLLADVRRDGGNLGQDITHDTEQRLVIAAAVPGAGGEHQGIRLGDIGGVERWTVKSGCPTTSEGSSFGRFQRVIGHLGGLDADAAFCGG
jgi:hypothetical protein